MSHPAHLLDTERDLLGTQAASQSRLLEWIAKLRPERTGPSGGNAPGAPPLPGVASGHARPRRTAKSVLDPLTREPSPPATTAATASTPTRPPPEPVDSPQ